MLRVIWLLMAGLVLVLATVGCQRQAETWDAMVAFDQAYIPALALTSQQQGEQARAVMPRVMTRWQDLQQQIPAPWTRGEAWAHATTEVTTRLQRADTLIADGHLNEAHDALEGVRDVLMAQRRAHDIDYFVDRLTAFHEPMEAIVLAAKGKSPAMLTDADLATIRQQLPDAQARWHAVEMARIDPERYRLSAEQANQLKTGITQEATALQALQAALDRGDRQRIIQTAVAIKPVFSQLFMLFGDFTLAK